MAKAELKIERWRHDEAMKVWRLARNWMRRHKATEARAVMEGCDPETTDDMVIDGFMAGYKAAQGEII